MLLAVSTLALGGASCGKKSAAGPDENPEGVVGAYDKAHGGGPAAAGAGSTDPVPGADLSKLDANKTKTFHTLADSLPSPCGGAQSLRGSAKPEAGCKRAPFAAKYVVALLEDGASPDEVREFYAVRYQEGPSGAKTTPRPFALEGVPHLGAADARVQVVEFFDYGCPACKDFDPVLKEALVPYTEAGNAVLFYKQFPLPSHSDSDEAAQAALAAAKQGKYAEMHQMLFANQRRHKKSDLDRYAEAIGLDMKQFQKDYQAAEPVVKAEVQEGDEAGVGFTPTVFINGKMYQGPMSPKYLRMWIDEELAVNR